MAEDHKVCIIMLGESGVGKTSLLLRFCKNIFREEHKSTLGVDKYNKTITLNNTKIELQLWDTVGQERFRTIVKTYFRKADGVLLVYDMTDHTTFMELPSWLHDLRELNEDATVLIVGNKADLRHLNQVSGTTVEKYARDEGLDFCETSAKNNENVDEVFEKLVLKVLERKKITPFYTGKTPSGEIEVERHSNSIYTQVERHSNTIYTQVERHSNTIYTQTEDLSIISLPDDFGSGAKKKKKGCC